MFGIEFDYSIPSFEELSPWLFFAPLIGATLGFALALTVIYVL